MAAASSDVHEARCRNRACPSASAGGRILAVKERGIWRETHRLRRDQSTESVWLGMPVSLKCPACGHHWLNPDLDGVSDAVERTIQTVAERVKIDREEAA